MFAPANLHLQRMSVFDTALKTSKCYFCITITSADVPLLQDCCVAQW